MGFSDEDFWKAKEAGISNCQLYKQAGNSIVVDVLYYIFLELYMAMPYLFDDIRLSSFFSGIGAFEKALEEKGPVWIECLVDREEQVLPMIPNGGTVEDMIIG